MIDPPIYRLDYEQTKMFVLKHQIGTVCRRAVASYLARQFPTTGAYVASVGLELIAFIKPGTFSPGTIELLLPPRRKVQRWECCNNDSPETCACRQFIDPEVRGPWRLRKVRQHHPLCNIGKRSAENWHEVTSRGLALHDSTNWHALGIATNPET